MYDVKYVDSILRQCQNKHRYEHSQGVAITCEVLAKINNYDPEKAFYTGLLHDITKQLDDEYHIENKSLIDKDSFKVKETWHAYTAEKYIKEMNIWVDDEIINAIRQHVEGSDSPSTLCKILFVADYIEPNRDYKSSIIARKLLMYPLDIAYATICREIHNHLVENGYKLTKNNLKAYEKFHNIAIELS